MTKKKLLLTFICAFIISIGHSQKTDSAKHYRISTKANDTPIKVKVKLPNKKYTYKIAEEHILPSGDTILVRKIDSLTYDPDLKDLDSSIFSEYKTINVSIKQNGSELILYPFPFDDDETTINDYLKDKQLVLKIKNNYRISVPYRSWEIGALTIPVKVYLSSRAEELKNNFIFDESVNLKISKVLGWEHFYKNKEDKDGKSFKHYFSFTPLFIGLSKTEISNTNTRTDIGDETFTVASLNYGVGLGYNVRGIGLSVLLGFDTPLSDQAEEWNFKSQPWIGFGFGIDL
ncbi:hypothetical protein [Mesoflavibacter sp. CH_XMU1422-2]|uniref:hypothetical protein n=1 Tax=Mesoflavibacter sp. CH_XMU1422-2 TaxID=3107770 RepID=UPI003009EBAF